MKKYYVAYGSNLCLKEFSGRCKDIKVVGSTILNNYKLSFRGNSDNYSYLTIEESLGSYVPLGIFEISENDEIALDLYEGYPYLYSKKYIDIVINGEEKPALIYIMNKKYDYHTPAFKYLISCVQGYHQFGFDMSILEKALKEPLVKKRKKKKMK